MPKYKIWKLQKFDKEKAKTLAETLQISPIITGILLNRGIDTEEEMRDFLYGNPKVYYEPLLMKNMDKASERILKAIKIKNKLLYTVIMT
jgi:single-stranded-DNA-specific exonuclease